MADDNIGNTIIPRKAVLISGRALILLAALAVLWTVLSWFVIDWQVRERSAALIAHRTSEARQGVVTISANMERVLNRLQGLAAVVAAGSDVNSALVSFGPGVEPSRIPYEARRTAWTQRPDLDALNKQLLAAKENIGVDIIWVMNAAGDCVAASNSAEATSFIGTNYSDRSYFSSAQAGKRGRQYAIGRITRVPGLFFSAPVAAPDGRFLGAVAIKNDLPRIAAAVNHPDAFVTDDQGVIILAADRNLEMRAVPDAAVHRLSSEQRQSRYMRLNFETLKIETGRGPGGLVRVAGLPYSRIMARHELPRHGITTYVLAPIKEFEDIRSDSLLAFSLLSSSGIMLLALIFGARAYVLQVRQYRYSMEARNEELSQLNEHLDLLARVDPLTGCANRRQFYARLEAEFARGARYGRECSLLGIDIDEFKRVNDEHGHAGGDEALRHFVQTVRRELRKQDELGRLGGEEFAVILPETGLAMAMDVAERIRHAVAASPAQFAGKHIPLTASFGVTCWQAGAETPDGLLQRVDAALYAAKAGGRNRVYSAAA